MARFDDACGLLEAVLDGPAREEIIAGVSAGADSGVALRRLRESMRANAWRTGSGIVNLDGFIKAYDAASRADGFHVLHDWDGKADQVNPDTIPVDVLSFILDRRASGPPDPTVLGILLDYYFAYVLMLLSTNLWSEGDPDASLHRLNALLGHLQSPDGSGQLFASDAETLLLIGTSHFEANDRAYDTLLERTRALSRAHRLKIALGHAATLGSHLRFGWEVTYVKDFTLMRDDNGVDYRWLCFALSELMDEYARRHGEGVMDRARQVLVGKIANGLSADPGAFVGEAPHASMAPCAAEWTALRDRLQQYRWDLVEEFKPHRPTDRAYSPIALFFNFSHNVLKGTVVDALIWAEAWHVSFNDLLIGTPPGDPRSAARVKLATTLMNYARAHPDSIGGRLAPVIVYDPATARRAFTETLRLLGG
jgi:hypothetical protein